MKIWNEEFRTLELYENKEENKIAQRKYTENERPGKELAR